MKYGMWLDEWFRNYIQPSSKIKTCERYSEIIEKHLKVKLGEYELDELTPLVLQRYVTELLRSGNIVTRKRFGGEFGERNYYGDTEFAETRLHARRTQRIHGRQNQTPENERERSILFFACRTEEDRAGGVIE